MREAYKPIVAYVGRLDSQKGVHLVRHALFYSLWNHPGQHYANVYEYIRNK